MAMAPNPGGCLVAAYNLERLNVLLVEDNGYVRNILGDLLRHFRFGKVAVGSNGAEGIDYLKTTGLGAGTIDLVISDLVMSPINGLLLLRWVRMAPESPNRFMPFVMLSGAADTDYVRAARDLGTSDFLAKPFSAETVYRKILDVIDHPRQFVTTRDYFGPDRRRRRDGSPPGTERRQIRDEDVVVVYSAEKVVKPRTPTDVWYFRLTNALKEKVAGVGASGKGELPTDLLAEAETQLQKASLDFTEWARTYLAQLSQLCTDALDGTGGRAKYFEEINVLAHELRGQGGTFGYPLMSVLGKRLYDCTLEGCRQDDDAVEIIKAHIDAMRAVIRDKVSGDGGQVGRALLTALDQAVAQHSAVA